MEQEVGGRRVDPDHRKLQRIGVVGHGDSISDRDDDLVRPGALLAVGDGCVMPESILSTSRLIAARTLAVWLMAAIAFAGGATLAQADQTASGQDVGSADDYMQNNPDPADAYEIPLLGTAVKNETEWAVSACELRNARFLRFSSNRPAGVHRWGRGADAAGARTRAMGA